MLVANTPMDTDKIKIYGARVKVDSFEAVAELEEAERQKMKEKVRKIYSRLFLKKNFFCTFPD